MNLAESSVSGCVSYRTLGACMELSQQAPSGQLFERFIIRTRAFLAASFRKRQVGLVR
jgi:hypothetical protein